MSGINNRFDAPPPRMSRQDLINTTLNRDITLYLNFIPQPDNIEEITTKKKTTIGELKKLIEQKFGLDSGFLNNYNLKFHSYRSQIVENALGDSTTIFDNKIRNKSTVIFGKWD